MARHLTTPEHSTMCAALESTSTGEIAVNSIQRTCISVLCHPIVRHQPRMLYSSSYKHARYIAAANKPKERKPRLSHGVWCHSSARYGQHMPFSAFKN